MGQLTTGTRLRVRGTLRSIWAGPGNKDSSGDVRQVYFRYELQDGYTFAPAPEPAR